MPDSTGYLTGTSLGRFRVGPLLGRGGMGDQDRLTRFIQEARSASALNHPHIVSVFDIGRAVARADGNSSTPNPPVQTATAVQYIAMEHCPIHSSMTGTIVVR